MVACASTSVSPGSLSSGSTSVRNRATPSRLDSSAVAVPPATRAAQGAEQHEVAVQPAQQVRRRPCGPVRGTGYRHRRRGRAPARAAASTARRSPGPPGVRRRPPSAAVARPRPAPDGQPSGTAGCGSRTRRCRTRHRRHRCRPAATSRSAPVGVASDPHRGVHERHIGHAEPVQQHGDRVHQHGGLVGDDLQRRAEAVGVTGGVDLDERLAGAAAVEPVAPGRRSTPGRPPGVTARRRQGRWVLPRRAVHGRSAHRRGQGRWCSGQPSWRADSCVGVRIDSDTQRRH